MNKHELFDKIESLPSITSITSIRPCVERNVVLGLVRQLDEPEKVKIPQFVADWIKLSKNIGRSLFGAMSVFEKHDDVKRWLQWSENQEIFAQAWIFGYEVEKEKRYRISMPKARNYKNHAQILCEEDGKMFWCGEWYRFKTKFTRKQLEQANFGWVFDCEGIEIEEVE